MIVDKVIVKCAVNGIVGRIGKVLGLCGYVKCGDKSLCGAPPDYVCKHKLTEPNNKKD